MKLGLQIPDFTWPDGAQRLAPTLAKIAETADEAGFDSIGVMDHFFQIRSIGPSDHEMLEARIKPIEIVGERIIPAVAKLEAQASPAH